jgi:hypothetical protein
MKMATGTDDALPLVYARIVGAMKWFWRYGW